MQRYDDFTGLDNLARKGYVITMGMLDGVHLGHQELLRQMRRWAEELSCRTMVVTFAEHPQTVLTGVRIPLITTLSQRLDIIASFGIDACIVLKFDRDIANIPAEDFCRDILAKKLHARGVILGFNARFGKAAEGSLATLQNMEKEQLFFARRVAAVRHVHEIISSTRIRALIQAGDIAQANHMLGRTFSLSGTVVHGNSRGKAIGFPTANLEVQADQLLPAAGVYATLAKMERRLWQSVTNIGSRPTFPEAPSSRHANPPCRIETHLFNVRQDLYEKNLSLLWVDKIRNEMCFPDAKALAQQIQQDIHAAKRVLRTRDDCKPCKSV